MNKEKILEQLQKIEIKTFELMPQKDEHTHLTPACAAKFYSLLIRTLLQEMREEERNAIIEYMDNNYSTLPPNWNRHLP